jgi:23S rRNA (adenine2503-C2)-methyltransferase
MAEDITGARMTNVVFMGIGEPFDNYDNVEKALKALVSPEGVGIGARKITVSTCGIVPGIKRFSRLGLQVNLSVSIHSADNAVRDELVPANRKYPIDELKAALKEYLENAGRKMTLEYTVIKGKNDSANDAKLLSALARDLAAKINLIECNTTIGQYSSPGAAKTEEFRAALERRGAHVTIRRSKGEDIGAACGQLAGARYVASK